MNRAKLMKSKSTGAVLALVVFVIVLMLVIGGGLLTLGANARILAIRTAADIAARCAADAGLTKALWVMKDRLTGPLPFSLPPDVNYIPLGGSEPAATYSYKVAPYYYKPGYVFAIITNPIGGSVPVPNQYVVESTGICGVAVRKVYALLRASGAGDTGVLVRESLTLMPNTTVAGRDSRDPCNLNPPVKVQIGTASTDPYSNNPPTGIDIDKVNVTINGDVLVGYGGVPRIVLKDFDGEYEQANVKGYTGTLDEEPEFPPVTAPLQSDEFKYYDKPISISSKKGDPNYLYIDKSWNGRYTMIDLDKNNRKERLIVKSGNDVVLHLTNTGTGKAQTSISLGEGCEIIVEEGATLNLYVDGDISSGNDSGFNNLGTPPDLKLWGTANTGKSEPYQDWVLNAKSEYFGQVYAPEASVTVNAKGELWGAFTTYSFEMKSGGNLFYDGALGEFDPSDPTGHFDVIRWREE